MEGATDRPRLPGFYFAAASMSSASLPGSVRNGVCPVCTVNSSRTGVAATICAWNEGLMRSEEHTSELQSLMRISYAVFCLKKKKQNTTHEYTTQTANHTNKRKLL